MNDVRLQADGNYFAYIEKKGFEDRDDCDGEIPWIAIPGTFPELDYNRVKMLIQHETAQLIKNSSLEFQDPVELKPFFWTSNGEAETEWVSDDAHTGEKCIGVNTLTVQKPAYWTTDWFPAKPSTYYYFEAYGKGKVRVGEVDFQVEFLDANGIIHVPEYFYIPFDVDWYKCSFTVQSPDETVYARISFGVFGYGYEVDFKADDFVLLECNENGSIIPPSTVTLTIQPLECNSDRTIDVYLGGCLGIGNIKPKLIWTDVKNHLYELYEETLPPFTGYGSARYCARHTSLELYKQLLLDMTSKPYSELQTMRNKVKALVDNYYFRDMPSEVKDLLDNFAYDRYDPYYHTSNGAPDDYMLDKETLHDIALWTAGGNCGDDYPPSGLPFGPGNYQYWSRDGVCRRLLIESSFLLLYQASKANMAVHLMNKYEDPKQDVWFPGLCTVNAEKLLLYGYPFSPPVFYESPLKDKYTLSKGFYDDRADLYPATLLACALMAFAELGYGFGYEEAKTLADDMADVLIQTQWGYPYTTMSRPQYPLGCEGLFLMEKSIFKWEKGSKTSELINRPDLAGAVCSGYKFDSEGRVMAAPRQDFGRQEATELYLTMPFEYGSYPAGDASYYPKNRLEMFAWLENTILFHRAMHVYHWYKFQRGTGAFPADVLPKGVNWLPAVSDEVEVTVT